MARQSLAVQQVARAGVIPSYSSAHADGHAFLNTGVEMIHVKNASGGSINVTIQTPGAVDGQAVGDRVVAIANGAEKMIGPFPRDVYNQADGTAYVDLSGVSSVTLAAIRIT